MYAVLYIYSQYLMTTNFYTFLIFYRLIHIGNVLRGCIYAIPLFTVLFYLQSVALEHKNAEWLLQTVSI